MADIRETLNVETELLKKNVRNLYNYYSSKINDILENNVDKSSISTIEELINNLNNEVSTLENNYKVLCIKILTKR